MQQKYALITGGSQGLGAAFARALVQQNYHLILVAKQKKGLTLVDDQIRALGGKATLIPFDLRNIELLDALIYSIAERIDHLDLLMLNAAHLSQLRPLAHVTDSMWEECLATNLTCNFRLLRGLDPLLTKAPRSDVIFVNDLKAENSAAYWGAYAITKSGFLTMAQIYQAEKENISQIRTHIFTPNPMETNLRSKAFPGENATLLAKPNQEAMRLLKMIELHDFELKSVTNQI